MKTWAVVAIVIASLVALNYIAMMVQISKCELIESYHILAVQDSQAKKRNKQCQNIELKHDYG